MIKRSGTNSLFNKLFPLQADFELLTDKQRRRLQIIWVGLAIFLAFMLFVVLLFLTSRTPDIVVPQTAILNTAPAVKNSAPAQPFELKGTANSAVDPNVDVIAGTVTNDSNFINIKLQVAGNIVQDSSLPQLTVYQIGFDTDLDASTGFQLNSDTIGAEYLADFDSKGNSVLLHWVQDQARFESISGLEVTQLNNNTLDFQIARASLSYPSQVNMALLSNDGGSKNQSFLPASSFANYQITTPDQANQPDPQPLWPYTISTSQTAINNSIELRQAANSALAPNFDVTDATIVIDSNTLTATLKVAGTIDTKSVTKASVAYYQLLLDTDNYSQDESQRLGFDANYVVDQDANGFNSILKWNTDIGNFEGVSGLQTTINGNTLIFVLPLSSIGNPSTIAFAFAAFDTRVSQQNYLPDHSYASISTFINAYFLTNTLPAPTADQAIQLSNTNLQIADGYLNATLQTAQALDTTKSNGSYYQLLLGQTLTQTLVLTDTTDTTALPANVLEPNLQVFYKIVFTPGQSASQAQLYSWSNQAQTFQPVQIIVASVNANTVALKIPLSAIGGGLIGYYFQTYNPQDGFNQLLPQNQPKQLLIPGSAHQMLVASSDITASNLLVNQVTLDSTATGVNFSVQDAPNQAKTTNLTFWIDSDLDPTTGQQNLHPALGVDYMLKYSPTLDSSHIQIYAYNQNQKTMNLVEVVPAQLNTSNNQLTFELPYDPDTLSLASDFNMVVQASSAVSNQTQSLPASAQDYARIDFQRQETTQTISVQASASNSDSNLQQFTLNFDGFYLSGSLAVAKLQTASDQTNYSINMAVYALDPKSTTPKLSTNYYLINYDPQVNRATLQRWSNDERNYQIVTQLDTVLDRQNNKIEFKFPYSLLGQPYYINYVVSAKQGNIVQTMPAFNGNNNSNNSDFFTVQQSSAIFYFKNSLQNSSFVMKQNAGQ